MGVPAPTVTAMPRTRISTDTSAETGAAPTEVDGVEVLAALSPSRALDFVRCPLRFRFKTVDRLPEPPTPAAVRGTLVHLVLERLFDLPAAERTESRARALLPDAWADLVEAEPESAAVLSGDEDPDRWLDSAAAILPIYFGLEDPRRLEPSGRELYVEHVLDSRLLLRGVIDRVDTAADGRVRIVDYKTGNAPSEARSLGAFFQLRFYALVLWRETGVVPAVLQLLYLGSGEVLRYEPDEADLLATERTVEAIWAAIRESEQTRTWLPSPGIACSWCAHHALCPAYGGTPPPLPAT